MKYATDSWISVELRLPHIGQRVEVRSHLGIEILTYDGQFVPWINEWRPL